MSLTTEIEKYSATVSTDSYSMSIGELVSMYTDGEIDIHPEFQRFFRWEPEQKSRLVESILLGIPIPPIYVSERSDSKWDVIDGLQRLSTFFELMGELKDESEKKMPPLLLTKTRYLPSLEGKVWACVNGQGSEDIKLSEAARIKIKRTRIDITIIKKSSDDIAKYEMFQRLNTGGTKATDQEVRSCIILMNDKEFLSWMQKMATLDNFRRCFMFSDKQLNESFDMELVTRFLVLSVVSESRLKSIGELGDFLTEEIICKIKSESFNKILIYRTFEYLFDYLAENLGENSFRKFNADKGMYFGPSLISLFEIIAIGVGSYLVEGGTLPEANIFLEKHKNLWSSAVEYIGNSSMGSGVRASTRIPQTISFGKKWVINED